MEVDIDVEKDYKTCLSNPFPATDSMQNSWMSFEKRKCSVKTGVAIWETVCKILANSLTNWKCVFVWFFYEKIIKICRKSVDLSNINCQFDFLKI